MRTNEPGAQPRGSGASSPGAWAALLAVSLVLLRLIHLDADTPLFAGTGSLGLFVDEGYKTSSARNLLLFGSEQWHPGDAYPGWLRHSPLTQLAYLSSFAALGATLVSARLVTIVTFLLFLLAFVYGTARSYQPRLLWLGVALLGLQHTLFFFSRVALFEVPLILCLYTPLFVLRRRDDLPRWSGLALVASCALVACFGVKLSAVVYFLPVLIAQVVVGWSPEGEVDRPTRDGQRRWHSLLAAGAIGLLLLSVVVARLDVAAARLDAPTLDHLRRVALNPLLYSSALHVGAGLLVAAHLILARGRSLWRDTYTSSLLVLALVGPLLFLVIPYAPLRYWVPLLPAYLLLALEWLHQRGFSEPADARTYSLRALVAAPFFVWGVLSAFELVCDAIVRWIPQAIPEIAIAGARGAYPFLHLLVLGLGVLLWFWRRRFFAGQRVRVLVLALLAVAMARDFYVQGRFHWTRTYQLRDITRALAGQLPSGAALAGDWAPLFVLGTDLKALYVAESQNRVEDLAELRPEYFVYSDTPAGRHALDALVEELEVPRLGRPLLLSEYAGLEVAVYPLLYDAHSAQP